MTQSPIKLARLLAIAWCAAPLATAGCARHKPAAESTAPAPVARVPILLRVTIVIRNRLRPSLQSLHERAQLGRYLEPEDLPGRSGDHDGPRSGRSLAACGAGTPGLSGRPVHRVRAAPVARVCASLAALAA